MEVVVTIKSLWSLQPPPTALSLTVTLKLIVLLEDGKTSHVFGLLLNKLGMLGKYRVGFSFGGNDLKFGPLVALATGGCVDISTFICSQQ